MYDYLIVGAGFFGAVFAHEAKQHGKSCLVVERRGQVGGNCYTATVEGIHVHQYGAHIFHTSDEAVWQYINQFCQFNNYVNSPIANYHGEIYNMPFNMNTFSRLWNIATPAEDVYKRQVMGRAVAGGGGKVAGDLVSPGHVQGILTDGHQLHMGCLLYTSRCV